MLRCAFPAVLLAALAPVRAYAQDEPARSESSLKYGRDKTVKLTTILPKGYDKKSKHPLVLAFPPGAGNAQMVATMLEWYWEKAGVERGYITVAVEGSPDVVKSGMKDLVPALFQWLDKSLSVDRARVVLAGVSAGGQSAFEVGCEFPARFAALLILTTGYTGEEGRLKALKGKPVRFVVGSKDEMGRKLAESTLANLDKVGAKATIEIIEGQDHYMRMEAGKLYDWMDALWKPAK